MPCQLGGAIYKNMWLRSLRSWIKNAPVIGAIVRSLYIFIWRISGRPVPPPHIFKVRVLKDYAKNYSLRTFVETGTYKGAMIEALKDEHPSVREEAAQALETIKAKQEKAE